MSKRIGIFSGSFDPIHKGHIAFALAALEGAGLDEVHFAPEPRPQRKPGVTHLSHRQAMIRLAQRPHSKLHLLDLPDKFFVPANTVPRIKKLFPSDELFMLLGSDHLEHMPYWPRVEYLLKHMGIVVGVRGHNDIADALQRIMNLPVQPRHMHVVETSLPNVASSHIRKAMRSNVDTNGLLKSVHDYAKKHWLYDALPN